MCLQKSSVVAWHGFNWSGDEIVYRPVIPACRSVPGTKRSRYPIDIREFLTTANNAVVNERLGKLVAELSPEEQALFRSHGRGSFDFRVDAVTRCFSTLRYLKAHNQTRHSPDAWLFPDETLFQGGGDCEDLAFLLAALLMAAGVSGYCLRVALGSLQIQPLRGEARKHDHCWVMYQNEAGVWEILDPAALAQPKDGPARKRAAVPPAYPTEYVPHYVFNADHLWRIRSANLDSEQRFEAYCKERKDFWPQFNPAFAASVHDDLFTKAIGDLAPASALRAVKRKSLLLDANIFTYDPRDHSTTVTSLPAGTASGRTSGASMRTTPTGAASARRATRLRISTRTRPTCISRISRTPPRPTVSRPFTARAWRWWHRQPTGPRPPRRRCRHST